jgi:predicted acyltransferase
MSSPDTETNAAPPGAGRLLSLDAFRGLTIAGMILVNNPGSGHVYPPLRHAEWHGWTPTDLVFPSFLFIAGVSIPLALGRRIERGDSAGALLAKVFWRSLAIFAIGLAMRYSPHLDLTKLRIPGVLQRIALCYLAAALIFLKTGQRGRVLWVLGLLFGYWLVMSTIPAPGHVAGDLSRAGNLAAYVDRALMPGHLYKQDYDPEGLLSTFPAVATTLIGVLAGDWLRSQRSHAEKAVGLLAVGTVGVLLGWIWDAALPINKALWTSSYVVLAGGLALQWLGVFYWLIEIQNCTRWAAPLVIFGRNALAAFVLSGLVARFLPLLKVAAPDGSRIPLKRFLVEHWFAAIAPPMTASLLFSITYVLFWLAVMSLLAWRKIYIRV